MDKTVDKAVGKAVKDARLGGMVAIAKALSDPSRLEILRMLAAHSEECCNPEGPEGICVCDFVEKTGLIQSLVSYHMRILREAGLVVEQSRGKWKHYRLDHNTLRTYLADLGELLAPGDVSEPVDLTR